MANVVFPRGSGGPTVAISEDGRISYSAEGIVHKWVEMPQPAGWKSLSLLQNGAIEAVHANGLKALSADHGQTWAMSPTAAVDQKATA